MELLQISLQEKEIIPQQHTGQTGFFLVLTHSILYNYKEGLLFKHIAMK